MMWLALLLFAPNLPGVDGSCANCHKQQTHAYYSGSNTMSRALYSAADAVVLRDNPKLEFKLGKYQYTIVRDGANSIYSVSDGASKLSAKIEYAFGQGAAGQTYVYRVDGRWYESRLSYYKNIKGLDLTMGAPPGMPRNLTEAAGREMTAKDVVACFGCHTTNSIADGTVRFERLQAGIGCENCHGSTSKHVTAFKTGNLADAKLTKLSEMNTEEQSDFCGRCHRTWADIATNGPRGIGNVRFQPYRIANSKCYDTVDRRIACTACHEAHSPLEHNLAAYDSKCTACHTGAKLKTCTKASANCASCHMPRYEIPGSHHLFTDHQIRIVRTNEIYPN